MPLESAPTAIVLSDNSPNLPKKRGRKTGFRFPETLEKAKVKQRITQKTLKHADELWLAQYILAVGSYNVFRREVLNAGTRRERAIHHHVENPAEIKEFLDTFDGGNGALNGSYYFITRVLPENRAIDSLHERTYGKVKESITIETTPLQFKLDVFAQFYAIIIKLCSQTPLTPETALELIRTASEPLNLDIAEVEEKTREYLGESASLLGVDTLANGE